MVNVPAMASDPRDALKARASESTIRPATNATAPGSRCNSQLVVVQDQATAVVAL